MQNLERFRQSSLLSKKPSALFPPKPSIITMYNLLRQKNMVLAIFIPNMRFLYKWDIHVHVFMKVLTKYINLILGLPLT